jgi:hypothetical protein
MSSAKGEEGDGTGRLGKCESVPCYWRMDSMEHADNRRIGTDHYTANEAPMGMAGGTL